MINRCHAFNWRDLVQCELLRGHEGFHVHQSTGAPPVGWGYAHEVEAFPK